MIKNSKVYDAIKYFAQIVLPAFGTLYFGLGGIWDLPKVNEVIGTIVVVDTFLGMLLGISSHMYNKSDQRFDGAIDKVEDGDTTLYSINVDGDPAQVLEEKNELTLKVNKSEAVDTVLVTKPTKRAPRKKS
jgi:hypothetical protein